MSRPLGSKDKNKRKIKSFWSKEQEDLLRNKLSTLTLKEIAKLLNKSTSSIRNKLKRLGLIKPNILKTCSLEDAIKHWGFSGIYGLLNTTNNYIYIGSSANISDRIQNHLYNLEAGTHITAPLQNDWDKTKFVVALLYICDMNEVEIYEQRFINSFDNTYNVSATHHTKICLLPKLREKALACISQGDEEECWEWTGNVHHSGYGRISFDGKTYQAHRLAIKLFTGQEPFGYTICHLCHNKLCCNPKHLQLGTIAINNRQTRDMQPKVIDKLETNKNEVLKLYHQNWTQYNIGKKYGVTGQTVAKFLHKHLDKVLTVRQKKALYTAFGETKTLKQWVLDDRCEVTLSRLQKRIKKNQISFEDMLITPYKRKQPKSRDIPLYYRWRQEPVRNYDTIKVSISN